MRVHFTLSRQIRRIRYATRRDVQMNLWPAPLVVVFGSPSVDYTQRHLKSPDPLNCQGFWNQIVVGPPKGNHALSTHDFDRTSLAFADAMGRCSSSSYGRQSVSYLPDTSTRVCNTPLPSLTPATTPASGSQSIVQ